MSAAEPDRRMGGWEGICFDAIEAGQAYAAYPLQITADDIAVFHGCLGEPDRPVDPDARIPSFLLNELRALKSQMRLPPGVLHAQEVLQMKSAARLGEPLFTHLRIADKYIRNGKRFVVVEQDVRAGAAAQAKDGGRAVLLVRHILYWPC